MSAIHTTAISNSSVSRPSIRSWINASAGGISTIMPVSISQPFPGRRPPDIQNGTTMSQNAMAAP